MTRILVVEDEPGIALGLRNDLTLEGYAVEVAADGETASLRARQTRFDLILLDVMLPRRDGFAVCRELRRAGVNTPVILLTARAQEAEKVLGLELGADDYVTKPFSPLELCARIKAVLRRAGGERPRLCRFGDVEVDFERCLARRAGARVDLTPLEFQVLEALLEAGGRLLSRESLIERVWGRGVSISDRVVDNHVLNLRRKLEEKPAEPRYLLSVRGLGYRLREFSRKPDRILTAARQWTNRRAVTSPLEEANMKPMAKARIIFTVALAISSPAAAADDKQAQLLLQAAQAKETVQGDLPGAIELYGQAVKEAEANRALAAKALILMGECYRKLGAAESGRVYEQVLRDYPEQQEAVAIAQARLSVGNPVYRSGGGAGTQLVWFDRAGKALGTLGPPGNWSGLSLAPDSTRAAAARSGAQGPYDIWLLDLPRNLSNRLTFHPGTDWLPVWSPDGSRIVFASDRGGSFDLYQKSSGGDSGEEPLLQSSDTKHPVDWSPDGRHVLYVLTDANTGNRDLWVLPLEGDRKPFPFLQSRFHQVQGQFSPDGKWVAYTSNESGRFQVYVQGFSGAPSGFGGKWQISANGGGQPRWRGDGRELFYLSTDRKLMAVEVRLAGGVEAGAPRELFQTSAAGGPFFAGVYDVTADGQRFLINSTLK